MRERLRAHGQFDAHVRLVETCVASIDTILRGEVPATDVLFPSGSIDLVEAVHRGSPDAAELNGIVAAAVRRAVDAGARRIIEIGAGTGGTTHAVLDVLADTGVEYHYTDVSPAFVRRGEASFRGRLPNLRFGVLNIERDPVAQGYEGFDVAIAANVLHATRRIDATLSQVKRLLLPNGTLVLNEATRFHAFTAVTFGLLDGWWLFEDDEHRIPHTPLLTVDAWRARLAANGFGAFADMTGRDVGQNVLVAKSAGGVVATVAEVLGVDAAEIDAPSSDIVATITRLVADAAEIDPREIEPDLPFTDFGIDSIMAVDVVNRISAALGVPLRATDLFNYSTIARLAAYIAEVPEAEAPSPDRGDAKEWGDVFDMLAPSPAVAQQALPVAHREASPESIAIVGISGRFAGARSLDDFWRNLASGRDCITRREGRWGGYLDDADAFDSLFFNISPREALQMDPQQRLFLETAWHAIEDAGYRAADLDGKRCGVFVGGGAGDYQKRLDAAGVAPEAFTFMGNVGSILAARISFFLNLKGPSIAIDTACSSSLTAIHLACESLRSGACEMALAGGVTVLSTASFHDSATRAGMLSPHGRCKTFDRDADGFVPAEGVGAILLKRLVHAIADNDRIYGVIRASATNQDGHTNGITAPSGPSQTALECEVYERAAISPETITLIEAHGTGTKLGDPIEVDALSDAFRRFTRRRTFCALGSVKANIGHALAAAGVASVLKVLLCLDRRQIPPSVHFREANEHLDLDAGPFFITRELIPWERPDAATPLRAAISSFGFSGTNVHLLIEEPPLVHRQSRRDGPHAVALSAKTPEALREVLARFDAWLATTNATLIDISYTSLFRRTQFEERVVFVAKDVDHLREQVARARRDGKPERFAGMDESGCSRTCGGRVVSLPSYPFAPERYTPETPLRPAFGLHPEPVEASHYVSQLDPRSFPLADHIVAGERVLPGVAYLEIARAAGELAAERPVAGFRNVVWLRPMIADGVPVHLHTTLHGERDAQFRIWSGDESQPVVHARGQVMHDLQSAEPSALDLAAVQRRCGDVLEGDDLYRRSAALDLDLGEGFRSVRNIRYGNGEALSLLRLPQCVNGTRGAACVLHPSLLDGALQSLMCFLPANERRLHVPFSLGEVRIFGPTPETCYVHARERDGNFDVSIADEEGRVRVALRNFSARAFAAPSNAAYYQPTWHVSPSGAADRVGPRNIEIVRAEGDRLAAFESLYARLRTLALSPPGETLDIVYFHSGDPFHAAAAALGATAMREVPRLRFHTIEGAPGDLNRIAAIEAGSSELRVRYVGGERHVMRWASYSPEPVELALHEDGAYLVSGGRGRIGGHVARFLAEEGAKNVIAFGRGDCDLADRAQTIAFVEKVRARFGRIRGIIHAAGISNDAMLANVSLSDARSIVAAKALGAIHLDEATRDEPLDFFILFSSLAAIRGNAGQGSYAYANAVLDALAERGRMRVIDWPLWAEGGMGLDQRGIARLAQESGLVPLETSAARSAIVHAMTSAPARFLVAQGDLAKFEGALNETHVAVLPSVDASDLARFLRARAAEALKIAPERLDDNRHLADYGMDSITFVELTDAINARYALDLSPAILFEHPTLRALTNHLGKSVQSTPKTDAIVRNSQAVNDDTIAIIGMAGVLPGSRDLAEFWEHLREGRDLVTEIPPDRWDWRTVPEAVRFGAFMPEVDKFDARFFGISPREAALMDPQHRIFLEVVWHAIEDAGWRPSDLAGTRTGIFVGVGHSDYAELVRRSGMDVEAHSATGMSNAMLPNRISFLLDLHGPSEPIDTACSSSLVALHRAAESIRRGECDMAIAGGVHAMLTPEPSIAFTKAGMLSPDGHCRTFDESANGYVRGEGAGAVFLKRLDRARADGDPIVALLLGSSVNHGGRASSLTAPNPAAQSDLIVSALAAARVSPSTIDYIEAHGTGTRLGDPVEIEGLKSAFAKASHDGIARCGLGSVKANIGHLETAAGIAGILKVLLAMKHRLLPPSANFRQLNPFVRLEGSPFFIVERVERWDGDVRRAGCSSFGFGGANAHIVLEAYEQPAVPDGDGERTLIILSAKNDERLRDAITRFAGFIEADETTPLGDIAYTLMIGREEMESRIALLVDSRDELRRTLAALREGAAPPNAWRGGGGELSFLAEDDDAAEMVERWSRKGKLESIARLWLAGAAIAWRTLPQCRGRRRVSLPPYPFARERHWFAATAPETSRPGAHEVRELARTMAPIDGIEPFLRRLLRNALHRLGDLPVAAEHARLHAALLALAGDEPMEGSESLEELRAEMDRLCDAQPLARPYLELTWTCIARYPEILSGRVKATDVMFPDSAMDQVEAVYRDNPLADFCNRFAAAAVASARPARVVEIGAGTGGTTDEVLRHLAARGLKPRYLFTDVSRAFLTRAQARFGGEYPFVEYDLLDIEREPAMKGELDVVLAANVLHATRDVACTLRNVRALLRPGGLLVLNEITRVQTFATLTFGLLGGWWSFEDAHRRLPHSPLLDVDGWRDALAASGFSRIDVLDGDCDEGRRLQQHVIVAVADEAEVRQTESPLSLVAAITAQCLGMAASQVDPHASFVDLGVDSILGVELVKRINRQLSLDLPATVLFDHPNVHALTAHIGAGTLHRTRPAIAHAAVDVNAIAVIGMAGRFPDAENLDAFWSNLAAGHCSIREVPPGRWGDAPMPEHRRGAFLDDIDRFDPLFFNMSGLDAELSDPQQRLFLEECWNALEDAGYASPALTGARCGVYVGVAKGDYQVRLFRQGVLEAPSFWGNEGSVLASRISYFLDLRGPSVAVNTACSSSLVAVHLACQALRTGDCEIAIAGGVYVGTTPNLHLLAGNAGMLSPDGVCRAFDQEANGFVPGEGVGAIILKPLAAALRDGDRVRGVIRASGVNQDGRTNGITAPSARSQTDLEVEVLEQAKIDAGTIGYIETHGTGTKLGDPIELHALVDTFRRYTNRSAFCAIGSVKTNIGHAITAAGISGLIKTMLALEHRQIPPSLHFRTPNEHLPLEGSPFFVNTELRAWEPVGDSPRRAAVSSFGFSGTNAHLVVEEAPLPRVRTLAGPEAYLFPLSARNERELRVVIERFARWLETDDADLGDIAYTLLVGRMHFRARIAFVARDRDELRTLDERAYPVAANTTADWRAALGGERPDDLRAQLEKLAAWYVAGGAFSVSELSNIEGRRRVGMPCYPFDRKRYWIAEETQPAAAAPAPVADDLPQRIRRIAADVLKLDIDDIATNEPLADYGMDSLAAIRIGQRLQNDFGPIPQELMFTCRTVDALCNALAPPPTQPIERSLAEMSAAGALAPIDAAALLSIPTAALAGGVTRDQVRALFEHQAYWFNVLTTSHGRLGLFFIPLFDDEVYADEETTVQAVIDACATAGRFGARVVALTGLIPSATQYGQSIADAMRGREGLPAITTGHAVTASAVVLAIERLVGEAGRALENERVGFLGAGSIGASVLMLMARCLPRPAEIVLCDVYGAEKRLEELSRYLREEAGFAGPIRLASSHEGVAAEIYSATLIVGATNVPNLLDIEKLQPGTLIVDDSAPHCFRTADAIRRFEERGDILFTEGGLLHLPDPVEQLYSVTGAMLEAMPAERMEALNWIGRDDANEIMGCMFSALLAATDATLAPTVGRIDWPTAERHFRRLKELGIGGAALHCEGYHLDEDKVRAFAKGEDGGGRMPLHPCETGHMS